MRLHGILHLLEQAHPRMHFGKAPEGYAGGNGYRVTGLPMLRAQLEALRTVPGMETEVDRLLGHEVMNGISSPTPLFEQPKVNAFEAQLNTFRADVDRFRALLSASLEKEPAAAVSVRLPPASDFKELASHCKELSDVFEQTLLTAGFEHHSIAGYDVGSFDVIVSVGDTAALALILAVTKIAMRWIKFKDDEAKRKLKAEAAAARESPRRISQEQVEIQYELTVEHELAELLDGIAPQVTEPEQRGRLRAGVIKLAGLLSKGAEITPSLTAEASVRRDFDQIARTAPPAPKQLTQGTASSEPQSGEAS